MSMGKPVVLSSGALEGIEAVPGKDVILADSAEEIAAGCCRLATSAEGVAIGAAARTRILRDYDWSARLRRFDDLLRPVPVGRVTVAV
jgi:polysaccharide biosynthesis protein PslH